MDEMRMQVIHSDAAVTQQNILRIGIGVNDLHTHFVHARCDARIEVVDNSRDSLA